MAGHIRAEHHRSHHGAPAMRLEAQLDVFAVLAMLPGCEQPPPAPCQWSATASSCQLPWIALLHLGEGRRRR
jgi:hypothetical protein